MNKELIITPRTKIFDIIDTYPELENVLVSYVPVFEKLKNPILRRTIGKVATLQQAAVTGGVEVSELVNHLRNLTGQQTDEDINQHEGQYNYLKPDFLDKYRVSIEFDVHEMLAAGEHPVAQVIADLKGVGEHEMYKLIAPFLPVPLIDKASGLGFAHWIDKKSEDLYHIYFFK